MVRTSSAEANRRIHANGRSDECTAKILVALTNHPGGTSRRALEDYTGLRANQITGRVNELIKQKRVAESAHKFTCPITGNKVFFVMLPELDR